MLADQIGNWLPDWKSPPKRDNYANAPKLRSISTGEQLYRTRCARCHTLTGHELKKALGPDLLGVTQRREMNWLLNWLKAPDQMIKDKDPIVMALYKQYNNLAMPNMRLNNQEALDLIAYIDEESQRVQGKNKRKVKKSEPKDSGNSGAKVLNVSNSKPGSDVVAIMNAWVREAYLGAKVNAGYMTLINVEAEDVTLVKVESDLFGKVEIHEMAMVDGLMIMRELTYLVIPSNGQTQLKPGGMHLMLMEPRHDLTTGQQVDMTLTFKSGTKQTVSVEVFATGGIAKDSPSKKSPAVEVTFKTTMGSFTLELNPGTAPKNCLKFSRLC